MLHPWFCGIEPCRGGDPQCGTVPPSTSRMATSHRRLRHVDTNDRYVFTATDFWAGAAAGCRAVACGGDPNGRILGRLRGRHDPAADHVQHRSRSQIGLGFAHVGQRVPRHENFRMRHDPHEDPRRRASRSWAVRSRANARRDAGRGRRMVWVYCEGRAGAISARIFSGQHAPRQTASTP